MDNRPMLRNVLVHEQGLIAKKMKVEELFAQSTLDL